MANPFVAEIRILPCNFAPLGWAFCDGQLLPVSQNTALFSLVGATYGGNGISTFALPDMRGNAPMFFGQGPGLSAHVIGEIGGQQDVTLLENEVPAHQHALQAMPRPAGLDTPASNSLGRASPAVYKTAPASSLQALAPEAISLGGSSFPHNNMMPYLTLNFCIALQGVFPPRS